MSTSVRAWIAGLLLAFSALVLTASAPAASLGGTGLLALVVLFTHGWIVAVAERSCAHRGGVEVRRFPLGPRLLQTRTSLFPQFLVPVALLAVVTRDHTMAGIALVAVVVLSVDLLRSMLPYLLPAGAAVYGLLTMSEFHTLGDLVVTGRKWFLSAFVTALWATVLAGTLLRTDVGGRLTHKGRLLALLGGLPGYAAAFWLFTRTSLAGSQPDLLGLCLVLLGGGIVQSIVVGLLAKAADIGERAPADIPEVKGFDIGLALLPMTLPILALLSLGMLPLGGEASSLTTPAGWAGLMVLLLAIPAVPAAALVGAGLDRVDRRSNGRAATLASLAALGLWFVAGPWVLSALYAPEGPVAALRDRFPVPLGIQPVVAADPSVPSLTGRVLGGDLLLFGLPATDLSRALTLMLAGCALLSARLLRHARLDLKSPGWGMLVLTVLVQAVGLWLLVRPFGPIGAPLATLLAAIVLLVVDALQGETVIEPEPQVEFEGIQEQGAADGDPEPEPATLSMAEAPSDDGWEAPDGDEPEPAPAAAAAPARHGAEPRVNPGGIRLSL